MKVLAVAPCFDEASQYSFTWYTRLRDAVKDKVTLQELLRDTAVRSAFESNVEAFRPDVIVFYNHGSEDCLCAQGGQDCVLDSRNVDKVSGKIIYTMACLSGRKLGAQAYARGCIYVGYVETFTFTTDEEQLFCEAANSGFIVYVNGEQDWAKIKQIMIEAFNKSMDQAEDPWAKMWLQWDRDALRIYALGVDTPESKCVFRKLAIVLFGPKVGWKLTKAFPVSVALFFVGLGILLHDYCHALWQVGGYREILSLQGGYFGAAILTVGFILAYYQLWSALRHA
jgi:hypothetical protein